MTSSNWELVANRKLSSEQGIGREALITSSVRELVEFYWTNRKRFSGGYRGFQAEAIQKENYRHWIKNTHN